MQVGAEGCADFLKPFILPAESTFKDIGGRANVVSVVYMPDPVGMLMPAQVARYAIQIGRTWSVRLPLRPGAPIQPDTNWEIGTASSSPGQHLIEGTSSTQRRTETMAPFSLAAHLEAGSSTRTMTPAQTGLKHNEFRTGRPSLYSDASSEDSDSCHVLSPRSDGARSPSTLEAHSSPFSDPVSGQAGGSEDRAAEALLAAEAAFMAADFKYSAAQEAQARGDLDLNEPVHVSDPKPQTSVWLEHA